jgi:hypothetical protein
VAAMPHIAAVDDIKPNARGVREFTPSADGHVRTTALLESRQSLSGMPRNCLALARNATHGAKELLP